MTTIFILFRLLKCLTWYPHITCHVDLAMSYLQMHGWIRQFFYLLFGAHAFIVHVYIFFMHVFIIYLFFNIYLMMWLVQVYAPMSIIYIFVGFGVRK